MTLDRWQQVSHLYHAALKRDPASRSAFLDEACAGDEALRREIASLLAQGPEAEGFLAAPPLGRGGTKDEARSEPGASPLIGRQLGVYRIHSLLGAGGMGEVYRAHDAKLGRDVAIKVLPAAFGADAERLRRFEREARMLAALNHPHIAAIYGFEEVDGIPGLVLELVEGPTLADRLAVAPKARPTNFSVVRVKRDLFGRSNIGAIYTRRAETSGGTGAGETFGVDALYSWSRSLNVNAYVAGTRAPGVRGGETSHLARFEHNVDRYGVQAEHLVVGRNFNPQVGFLRRTNFQREFALARFSPRPARTHMKAVRRFVYQGSVEYVESTAGTVETREMVGTFQAELMNGDVLTARYTDDYELIPRPFPIAPGVSVPVGGYDYRSGQVSYLLGPQRTLSGTLLYQQGSLYGGTKKTAGLSGGRVEVSSRFAIEPIVSANWVELPWGDFSQHIVTLRNTYTMTPRMFTSALVQYNSSAHTLGINARFRWEYQPGSELFVVYSDGRDTVPKGFPELLNRAFVVKVNRLFRF